MCSMLDFIKLVVILGNVAAVYEKTESAEIGPVTFPDNTKSPHSTNKYPTKSTLPKNQFPVCTRRSTKPRKCEVPQNLTNIVVNAFFKYSIVPQVIPCSPLGTFTLTQYWEADPEAIYTFVILNADTNFALYGTYELLNINLLIVNIPGNNLVDGDTLLGYRPYLPIPGYGTQRYVGLVYEQPERIEVTPELTTSISASDKFNLSCFVDTFDLGDPIFGNFVISSLSFCDSEISKCASPSRKCCGSNYD